MHEPAAIGWRVGDHIGVAPTNNRSEGTGQNFIIVSLGEDNNNIDTLDI